MQIPATIRTHLEAFQATKSLSGGQRTEVDAFTGDRAQGYQMDRFEQMRQLDESAQDLLPGKPGQVSLRDGTQTVEFQGDTRLGQMTIFSQDGDNSVAEQLFFTPDFHEVTVVHGQGGEVTRSLFEHIDYIDGVATGGFRLRQD